jgi:hypothetical protein
VEAPMNLDTAKKLLTPKEGSEFIGLNSKAADDLRKYVEDIHVMLVGIEPCSLTVPEFRQLMIRLYPDAKRLMQHTIGINRVITAVSEHIFMTGSGVPEDIAKFRHQVKVLTETGKLDLKE